MSAPILRTSNVQLAEMFDWAVAAATSHRVDGGTVGPLDVSERTPEGKGTARYEDAYWAGYTHRSGVYLRDFAHQAVGAHLLGWQRRNADMLAAFVRSADGRHGGWPWWAINFDLRTPLAIDYDSADRFVRELPAVFELVETAHVLHRWTADADLLAHAGPAVEVVTGFAERHARRAEVAAAIGPGIFDGTATYNEQPGIHLSEAGDSFAAQYAATRHAAGLVADPGTRAQLIAKADRLREHYRTTWSRSDAGVVCGWTDEGEPITSWARETTWFPLLKGLLVDERTADELDAIDGLCLSESTRPRNIEALTYLPDMFFRHGRVDQGWAWMQRIHAARDDAHEVAEQGANGTYPEVPFTLLAQTVLGIVGLEPDAPRRRLAVRPGLPTGIDDVAVEGVPFADGTVDIALSREGADIVCEVSNATSAPLAVAATGARGFRDPHLVAEDGARVDAGSRIRLRVVAQG